MGDAEPGSVHLSFNPQLRVEFQGATVTSDAGLMVPRESDERLGLSALIGQHLADPRIGRNRQFPLPDLFRPSLYSRLVGYADTNDAERVAEDPVFRMLASRERRETSGVLTSTLHWFETDSSESPVHGAQEPPAYNGRVESVCYHPLFVFNQGGDSLAATLRPGNVHRTDGWDEVLAPVIDRSQARGQTVLVRADGAGALPALHDVERQGGHSSEYAGSAGQAPRKGPRVAHSE